MADKRRGTLLWRLNRLDRTTTFLVTLALVILGLFLPAPLGPILLYVIIAALAALLSVTWAVTPPPMRILRLIVLAGLAAIVTARLL